MRLLGIRWFCVAYCGLIWCFVLVVDFDLVFSLVWLLFFVIVGLALLRLFWVCLIA